MLEHTLTKDFGEYRWGWGFAGGEKAKFFRNPKTMSFTVISLPRPDVACLVMSGKGFVEDIEAPPLEGKSL